MISVKNTIAIENIEQLDQISFKNAEPSFWKNKVSPTVLPVINLMLGIQAETLASLPATILETGYRSLLDVKYWPCLKEGVKPVINDWHYDSFPDRDDPRSQHEFHLLWYQGVSRTEFSSIGLTEPNKVYLYTHDELHRGTAAETTGPRLFIRLSYTQVTNRNQMIKPVGA